MSSIPAPSSTHGCAGSLGSQHTAQELQKEFSSLSAAPLGNSTPASLLLLLGAAQAGGLRKAEKCVSLLDIHAQS